MKKLSKDNNAVVPLVVMVLSLLAVGGIYTMLFIVVAPSFNPFIPSGVFRTIILGICNYLPMVIIIIWILSLVKSGMKQSQKDGGYVR